MAIKIGTNFSYNGRQFLDTRQRATTKRALLSWSITVPNGFEVYCEEDNKWYAYDPDYIDLETGHFKLRINKELEDSEIQATVDNNTEDILKLDKKVFPLHFENILGGGDFEQSRQILPLITWNLYRGDEYVIADQILVNGVPARYKELYVPDTYITSSTTYAIDAYYEDETCHTEVSINLYPFRYVFVNSGIEVTSSWILAQSVQEELFIKELDRPFETDIEYSLNCSGNELSGGKHVHLVFPSDFAQKIINGQVKMLVGGIEFSDFSAPQTLIINGETYYNIVFTYPQNSSKLDIILKHQ